MAKPEIYRQLAVTCLSHQYPIVIGGHLLKDIELLSGFVRGPQALIVTNQTIALLYLEQVQQAFQSKQCDVVILEDGEIYKNQQSLWMIYDALMKQGHHRDTTLIALGGGVVGDITGFAASTFQRGVEWIQIPTTLLAQVDSSVGGKTAINHPLGKNMIGSFYQPHAVIMDLTTLQTLPIREFRAGFAEIIKYGLLVGGSFLEKLFNLTSVDELIKDQHQLADLIDQCCKIKSQFVEEDEKEHGRRALLNLGHTFAHALESYTNYQRWLHGEAVAIGLYCAALLSYQMGYFNQNELDLIDSLLKKIQLPRRIPKEINIQKLKELMNHDKKIKNKSLRFVVMKQFGDVYLDDKVSKDVLHDVLIAAVKGDDE